MPGTPFVCLSDVDVPGDRVPLVSGWPGWWAKIELFDWFKGQTIYFDLDTVLVADPRSMLTGEFQMCRNWNRPDLMTSAVMAWAGDCSHIPQAFREVSEQVMRDYVTCEQWGDQAFIAEHAGSVKAFADGDVLSYRLQGIGRRVPDAKVVAFNATCPPWSGPDWARQWW